MIKYLFIDLPKILFSKIIEYSIIMNLFKKGGLLFQSDFSRHPLKESEFILVVRNEHVFRLTIMIQHHQMGFTSKS